MALNLSTSTMAKLIIIEATGIDIRMLPKKCQGTQLDADAKMLLK